METSDVVHQFPVASALDPHTFWLTCFTKFTTDLKLAQKANISGYKPESRQQSPCLGNKHERKQPSFSLTSTAFGHPGFILRGQTVSAKFYCNVASHQTGLLKRSELLQKSVFKITRGWTFDCISNINFSPLAVPHLYLHVIFNWACQSVYCRYVLQKHKLLFLQTEI